MQRYYLLIIPFLHLGTDCDTRVENEKLPQRFDGLQGC